LGRSVTVVAAAAAATEQDRSQNEQHNRRNHQPSEPPRKHQVMSYDDGSARCQVDARFVKEISELISVRANAWPEILKLMSDFDVSQH
jgi:hypothetical protein